MFEINSIHPHHVHTQWFVILTQWDQDIKILIKAWKAKGFFDVLNTCYFAYNLITILDSSNYWNRLKLLTSLARRGTSSDCPNCDQSDKEIPI